MKFDNTKGYKIVNGEFVERAPEEQAEIEQKWISLEAASDQGPSAKAKRSKNPAKDFIGCPMWWFLSVLPIVKGEHQLAVALYVWKRKITCEKDGETFKLPNSELKRWGVSRWVKYDTLKRLADAGLIKISRSGKEALTITIMQQEKPPCRKP
jgi:hypothetical protein